MLTIRLSRIGKRKQPMYRLIISEKGRDPKARVLENLGSYNPFTKALTAKNDRINYWLKQGSGISATANNLLIDKGVIKREKVKASKPGNKAVEEKPTAAPAVKTEEKATAKAEETPVKTEEKAENK